MKASREVTMKVNVEGLESAIEGLRLMDAAFEKLRQRVLATRKEHLKLIGQFRMLDPNFRIRLYSAARTKVDPIVPVSCTGARFDSERLGWEVEVGLYEPIFIPVEEVL